LRFERGRHFLTFQIGAKRLKFVESDLSFGAQLFLVIHLLDHLTHFPLRNLEADHVQRIFQFAQIQNVAAIFVQL
jgi:hypothetical protein